jgi:hypothetical protein
MAEEKYIDLVNEIVGYSGTVILLLREIVVSLEEKREIHWFTEDRADAMLRSLEEEVLKLLGVLAQGR